MITPTYAELQRRSKARRKARPEQDWQMQLVKILDQFLRHDVRYFHVPNGEKRDRITAAILIGMGVKKGVPDLIFIGPGSKVFQLECKDIEGKLSTEQEAWMEWSITNNCNYAVASTLEQAMTVIIGWKLLKRGFRFT